jgi:hypothetical protein
MLPARSWQGVRQRCEGSCGHACVSVCSCFRVTVSLPNPGPVQQPSVGLVSWSFNGQDSRNATLPLIASSAP